MKLFPLFLGIVAVGQAEEEEKALGQKEFEEIRQPDSELHGLTIFGPVVETIEPRADDG